MPLDDAACCTCNIHPNTRSDLELPMPLPGPMELLIIFAIFLIAIVIPLSIVWLVVFLVKSTKSPRDDNQRPD